MKKKNNEEKFIICVVKNCQKKVPKNEAILIEGEYFCKICGVAKYRNLLNI